MQLRLKALSPSAVSNSRRILKVVAFRDDLEPTPRRQTNKAPVIDRLGGLAGVRAAVDVFYTKVLADDRVNFYFSNRHGEAEGAPGRLHDVCFRRPQWYKGKDMVTVHKHLIPHLEEEHFNAIVEHFVATLHELGVPQEDIDAAVAVVPTTKADVLAR